MRFIHTADWHLGKLFGQRTMTEDQAFVLEQLVAAVKEYSVEAVVIAGDIYDRSVPPAEAVELFSSLLARIRGAGASVLFIAGNHDSGRRLSFGEEVLDEAGVYVRGRLSEDLSPVILSSATGPVAFSLLPYFDPYDVREVFGIEERLSFDDAAEIVLERARAALPEGMPSVAVAHAFLAGGEKTESVRALSVGGSDQIAYTHFSGYDYTALGHLHGPWRAGADTIRYSGSPLCYSFDEVKQKKGFYLVDMDEKGKVKQEFHPLTPRHAVRIVEGTLEELRAGSDPLPKEDYCLIRLLDRERPLGAREKLQAVYANIFGFEFPNLVARQETAEGRRKAREGVSDAEQFADFYREMTGKPMTEEQSSYLAALLEELAREERTESSVKGNGQEGKA